MDRCHRPALRRRLQMDWWDDIYIFQWVKRVLVYERTLTNISSLFSSLVVDILPMCVCCAFKEWFPGWQQYDNYNRQPNDDGFSDQDCVEARRFYHRPSTSAAGAAASELSGSSFLVDSFMWNDRDCLTRNFYICERPMVNGEWLYSVEIFKVFVPFLPLFLIISTSRARPPNLNWKL